jgi:hypothetical protein
MPIILLALLLVSTPALAQHWDWGSFGGAIAGGAIGSGVTNWMMRPRAPPQRYQAPPPPPQQYVPEGPPTAEQIAYCARQFRSYDARTGTYMGYDGYPHRCP